MWLSEKLASLKNTDSTAEGIIRQSADRRVSAAAVNGTGQYSLAGIPGIIFKPMPEDQAILVRTEGGAVCIGVRINDYDDIIEPGELILRSAGGAVLKLSNDGKIYINGRELE